MVDLTAYSIHVMIMGVIVVIVFATCIVLVVED